MDLQIVKFMKKLSNRDRTFYLLMRAYEKELKEISGNEDRIIGVGEIYEDEILRLIEGNIYDSQTRQNDKAESSEKSKKKEKNNMDEFAESLGQWASSFSSEDGSDITSYE